MENYSGLFEGLSNNSEFELIESLSKSLKAEGKTKDAPFYKSFGAFFSVKTVEEIVKEIRSRRKFRKKGIHF